MLGTSCEILNLTGQSCEAHIGSNINQSENDSHCFIESTQTFELNDHLNNSRSFGSISLHANDTKEHYHNNNKGTRDNEYPWITLYVGRVIWNISVYYIDTPDGLTKTICNIELACDFNIWEVNSGNFHSCDNLNAILQDMRQSVCENGSISVGIPDYAMNQIVMIYQTNVFKINNVSTNYCMGKYHNYNLI